MSKFVITSCDNCLVCNDYLGPFRNSLTTTTEYCEKPIYEVLESLISARITRRVQSESSLCQDCFAKVEKYNHLQSQCFDIQQNLYDLYHNLNNHHRDANSECIQIKMEDTAASSVRISCQKCQKTFRNLREMSAHKKCRKMPEISKAFIESATLDYDYKTFQDTFFTPTEKKASGGKKLQNKIAMDDKISHDFKVLAAQNGIKYDIDVFHKTFGFTDNQLPPEERKKAKVTNFVKKKTVSNQFLKTLGNEGVEYNLEMFQRAFGYTENTDYQKKLNKLGQHDDAFDKKKKNGTVKCQLCEEKFTQRAKFIQHMKTHSAREFYCEECQKEFKTKINLTIHHATDHDRQKIGPFECPACFKTYPDRTALRTHYHIHVMDRSYLCGQCGANFYHKKSFEMHSLIHDDIRPFSCEICSKKFRTNGKLTIHLRVHSGVKLFECPHCPGRRFAQKWGMDLHIKKTHMNEISQNVQECRICGMHFPNKSKLKAHLANAHEVAGNEME